MNNFLRRKQTIQIDNKYNMQTRSQTRLLNDSRYTVEIDFDGASEAWKANKIPKGNGTYAYRCCGLKRDGFPCTQMVSGTSDYCKRHLYR